MNKLFYKVKLWGHRIKVHTPIIKNYWKFDMVEQIPFVLSTYFVDFYENGQLDLIDWDSDPEHKQARKDMTELYIWFKWWKPMLETFSGKMMDEYWEYSGKPKNIKLENTLNWINKEKTEEEIQKWKYCIGLDNLIAEKNKYYMAKLVGMHEWLWT